MAEIETFEELLSFPHPYLHVLAQSEWRWGWSEPGVVAALFGEQRPFLLVLGQNEASASRALHIGTELFPNARVAIERPFAALLEQNDLILDRSDWDWMAIYTPGSTWTPRRMVIDLNTDHDDAISHFLSDASPTASTAPGDPEVITWHGIVDGEKLLAVGAATRWKSGAAVLASIAVAPEARGQGLGTDITASLTNMLFEHGEKRVSLGMYAANSAARRAYEKVGYQLLGEFTSAGRTSAETSAH